MSFAFFWEIHKKSTQRLQAEKTQTNKHTLYSREREKKNHSKVYDFVSDFGIKQTKKFNTKRKKKKAHRHQMKYKKSIYYLNKYNMCIESMYKKRHKWWFKRYNLYLLFAISKNIYVHTVMSSFISMCDNKWNKKKRKERSDAVIHVAA